LGSPAAKKVVCLGKNLGEFLRSRVNEFGLKEAWHLLFLSYFEVGLLHRPAEGLTHLIRLHLLQKVVANLRKLTLIVHRRLHQVLEQSGEKVLECVQSVNVSEVWVFGAFVEEVGLGLKFSDRKVPQVQLNKFSGKNPVRPTHIRQNLLCLPD
jgi:hypothetical protein